MNRPSIDHSLLSPSGRMSKRARAVALKREAARLFPPDFDWSRAIPQPTKREQLLRQATHLRDLAAQGMKPRAYRKEAERLERLAREEPI